MMDGSWSAKTLVTKYLAQDVPSRIIDFRNYWGLSSSQLPTPVKWLQYEPFVLEHWPTVITLVTSTSQMTLDDYSVETGDPKYTIRYGMRTYVWVRGNGPEETTMMRDNLTTVVRDALLDNPALNSLSEYTECRPHVDDASMVEEFSDLTLVKGERLLAGSFLAYSLDITESITSDPLTEIPMLAYNLTVEQMPKTAYAPAVAVAVAGDTEADLYWRAPEFDGGIYPVTSYLIEQSEDDGDTWATVVADTASADPAYTVTGLTNGNAYRFRVSAINQAGTGSASPATNSVIPTA